MAKKLVLFGPPASGKSTLLDILVKEHGRSINAIELESFSAKTDRQSLLEALAYWKLEKPLVVTAADVAIPQIPPAYDVALLWIEDREVYLREVAERDATHPSKAGQNPEKIYDLMKEHVVPLYGNKQVRLKYDRTAKDLGAIASEIAAFLSS